MSRNLNDQQFHDAHKFDVSKVDWSSAGFNEPQPPAAAAMDAVLEKRAAKRPAPKKVAAPKTYPKLRSVK